MRILIVQNYYRDKGGEETYFWSLKKLLQSKGHKVITYTKNNHEIKSDLMNKIQIAINMFKNRTVMKEVENLINRHHPDIIHCNNIFPLITPSLYHVCNNLRVPIVQTLHNYQLICPGSNMFKDGKECVHNQQSSFIRRLFNTCYHNSLAESFIFYLAITFHKIIGSFDHIAYFIFPSFFSLKLHLSFLHLQSNKTVYIPNFLELLPPKNHHNKKNRTPYMLFISRFSEEKGILELLQIASEIPQIKFLIIGDGPLRKKVNEYRRFRNIKIKSFIYKRAKLYKYIQNALYVVIASKWYEVLPFVMLESFANGTPVITPNIGVFKVLLKGKKLGLKYKFNDPIDLKRTIIKAWNQPKLRERMRKTTVQHFKKNYTPEIHYQKLLSIYKAAIINQ